ncbi:SRPBCC family protein [Actinophytocola oryzae]|uniref:Uncharacterized protein YndB with AHSA1/START domain n=1 Tax=Actinophytocola oryzae TaxID=502181 RepID=A0A4R7UQE2_9PSEU|nr:SRPBCC family protein [Actinophytocola oryzae]TDV34914.1 uncharacterized protein YndB with AHSA1/START domain [Actinophytocola oryzae]
MTDATLSYVNGEPTLRFERTLRHSPAKVWRAVTEPAELRHWFPAEVEVELRPGAPMRFVFPEEAVVEGSWDGEVLEVDEPKVFMFRWNSDVLRIELIPEAEGCRLVFSQTLGGGRVGRLAAGRTAAGWDTCLDQLAARLDGTTAPEQTDWLARMAGYVEKFGLGDGTATSTEDGYELRFSRDLVWKPPATSWQFLTDGVDGGIVPPGRVVDTEPPHVLEYEWQGSTVRWEFRSDPKLGERVELTLTVPADRRAAALATWHHHMELFFAVTMGDEGATWSDERVAELTGRYEAKLG